MAEEKNSGSPGKPADAAGGPPQPANGGGSTGLDPKVASLLCYLFGWVSGLIFFLIEKDDKDVRFHALQSILVNAAVFVILIAYAIVGALLAFVGLGVISMLLYPVLLLGFFVLWIVLMVKAYGGERWKLPVVGDIAERNS